MVPNLFKAAGIEGHFTNHSLRATSAMRLFETQIDEQLIMQRTGHSSTAVQAYKCIGEKLKSVTSDALNNVSAGKKQQDEMHKVANNEGRCKEKNRCPAMNLAGASHFTVNINYKH